MNCGTSLLRSFLAGVAGVPIHVSCPSTSEGPPAPALTACSTVSRTKNDTGWVFDVGRSLLMVSAENSGKPSSRSSSAVKFLSCPAVTLDGALFCTPNGCPLKEPPGLISGCCKRPLAAGEIPGALPACNPGAMCACCIGATWLPLAGRGALAPRPFQSSVDCPEVSACLDCSLRSSSGSTCLKSPKPLRPPRRTTSSATPFGLPCCCVGELLGVEPALSSSPRTEGAEQQNGILICLGGP
mmetsp:Transcript_13494/g.33085  ORF Transcript_13494/g.33085 Transcript_13494/m.33085 type:complete len:241 (+) Transcript_13494:1560-2282(+)